MRRGSGVFYRTATADRSLPALVNGIGRQLRKYGDCQLNNNSQTTLHGSAAIRTSAIAGRGPSWTNHAIRGLTCSHLSLRYRHDAAFRGVARRPHQACVVQQTNSGNLPTAAFDGLEPDPKKQALGPRPDGWKPVFPRDERKAFARRSCSRKEMRS